MASHSGHSPTRSRWAWIVALLVLFAAAAAAGWIAATGAPSSVVAPLRAMLDADGDGADAAARAGAGDAEDGTVATAPTTAASAPPPVARHRVRVATRPQGAKVTITPATGGEPITGTSPLTAQVPEGRAWVKVARPGHQRMRRRVVVKRDRTIRWWLDPRGQLHHKLAEFPTGAAPKQVAFTPDGRQLWVTLLGGPGVQVHTPTNGKRLATIDLGDHGSVEVIFTEDGSTAYVSQMESASVYEIDTATFEVRRRMPTGGSWTKVMALSPDEKTLFASNWSSNDISEINLRNGKVRRRLPAVPTPRGLYVTPNGKTLYVAGFGGGQLQRIDLRNGSSSIIDTTGGAMRHLVGDPDGDVLYAGDMGTDAVYTHRIGTGRVDRLAVTDAKPNTIDLSPDGRVLYVSNRGANNPESYYLPGPEWGSVLALDTETGEPLDAIVGGNQTTGLDVSDDGTRLAFSDFLDNQVQIYEIPRHDVLARGDGGRYGRHRQDVTK